MITFLYSLLGFIIAIGVLATVHEFGHFWVARRLGVKVLRFNIGFGKPFVSWYDKKGTEYGIGAIPLGGYVKMLDQTEGKVDPKDLHLAYNKKPVWVRMLIIAAGPAFNMAFAVLAYWVVFMWGIASVVPVIGEVPQGTIAYKAGLHSGQEIVSINAHTTPSWEDIVLSLASHIGDHDQVNMTVRDIHSHATTTHVLNLNNWTLTGDGNVLMDLGLEPYDPFAPIVGKLLPDYPAAAAGIQEGDRIVNVNGKKVMNRAQLLNILHNNADKPIEILVERKNKNFLVNLTPVKNMIGIQFAPQPWPPSLLRTQHYGPIPALDMAFEKTIDYSVLTVQFLGKMITGKISSQYISGPISIAQYAGYTVRTSVESFLGFLALVSISLGILNMLPIPILDGGHFLFCVIELVRGKALSMRAMRVGYAFGMALLGSVMVLAFYNDITRLMH